MQCVIVSVEIKQQVGRICMLECVLQETIDWLNDEYMSSSPMILYGLLCFLFSQYAHLPCVTVGLY